MTEKIPASGVNGSSGQYALAPLTDLELAVRVQGQPAPTSKELAELLWWIEQYGVDDPNRGPVEDVDPRNLASAGWGVLFAPDVGPDVREALEPLVARRRELAGPFFKVFEHVPGQSREDFLAAQKAPPGPADPDFVPYYLLIVGDPGVIPFDFQCKLDVQYAVGRVWFDAAEDYARYAWSVVRAETSPPVRPKRIVFFGPANRDDPATQRSSQELVALADTVSSKRRTDWEVGLFMGPEATKEQLGLLLGGGKTPSLLVTAGHGITFGPEDPRLLSDQGALLCQDWPGPQSWNGGNLREHYFSAEDVADDADLHGLIAFNYASFGGGTHEFDDLAPPRTRLAPQPFIARLPQRLLSHPGGGALAVISPVDRVWMSFREGQIQMLGSTLRRLIKGFPLGSAMEYVNQRHAELAVRLAGLWEDRSSEDAGRWWRAYNDFRNLIVFGDPAVCLAYRES